MGRFIRPSVALLVMSLCLLPNASADPILSIQLLSSSVVAGSTFAVDVNIANVSDLYGFQFDIGFTPGILSAAAITEGPFLPGGGTTSFLPGVIDNTVGTIAFNADSLIGAIPGVSGSGTLAILDFSALAAGTGLINIANVTLLDSSLSPINSTVTNGTVFVSQSGTAPEPSSLLLLSAGGFGIFAMKCRKVVSRRNGSV